jgi:ribonucleoside-diphosphate reductase alpha chain
MPGRLLPPLLLAIVSTCIARDVSASQLPSASLLHRPSALPTSNALAAASPRNQQRESMAAHLRELCTGLDASIDPEALATKVCDQLPAAGATEEQITELMAETAAYQASMHPDFARLAARVAVSRLHARTDASVLSVLRTMRHHCHNGEPAPLVSEQLLADAEALAPALEAALQHERDFDYDYFGLRTLQRSYLHKDDHGQPIERPQHMLMRVALCVHGRNEAAVLKAYELMAAGMYTHATPTLFNAGSPRPQLCSCFLLTAKADSIAGIFDTLRQCALISRDAGGEGSHADRPLPAAHTRSRSARASAPRPPRSSLFLGVPHALRVPRDRRAAHIVRRRCTSSLAAGIGVSVSHIRAANSYIRSSGGRSSGLVPMLRVFDATARYVDQGGGKRKGAFAVYLEPWHADVEAFLELKKNHGKEEARARDLFYALWISDLFMKRVEAGEQWSLFCPDEAPGLVDVYGAEFDALYERYEREGRARKAVPAQQLWLKIVEAQMETGTPYMLYKVRAMYPERARARLWSEEAHRVRLFGGPLPIACVACSMR